MTRKQPARQLSPPSLPADPADRQRAFWRMTPAERVAVMRRGELTLAECCRWASRAPHEVPLLHGEFEFIAAFTPEVAEAKR